MSTETIVEGHPFAGRQQVMDGLVHEGDILVDDIGQYWNVISCGREIGWPIKDGTVETRGAALEMVQLACYRELPVAQCQDRAAMPKPESCIDEAVRLVLGDRNDAYGDPRRDFEGVAAVWSGLLWDKLTRPITAEEALLMMAALKLRRRAHKPGRRDDLVDAYGYLLCTEWASTGCKPDVRR